MADLFLSNVPCDCDLTELKNWIEAQGFRVKSLELIQDLVALVAPSFAYVELIEVNLAADAIRALNQTSLRDRIILVQEDWRTGRVRNAA
jgi:hypothetical protein